MFTWRVYPGFIGLLRPSHCATMPGRPIQMHFVYGLHALFTVVQQRFHSRKSRPVAITSRSDNSLAVVKTFSTHFCAATKLVPADLVFPLELWRLPGMSRLVPAAVPLYARILACTLIGLILGQLADVIFNLLSLLRSCFVNALESAPHNQRLSIF